MRHADRTWIVWSYPRQRYAEPVVLPVVLQTAPLHRSHVRLDMGGRAVTVHTLEGGTVPGRDCELVGQCTEHVVAMIEQTMRRAIEAEQSERQVA